MANVSVSVEELSVPLDAVRKLTQEQRYAYYLLGLIHNESMTLRKLISFSLPVNRDLRPFKRGPEMGQTLFLFRIACCKIWEAQLKINKAPVRSVLANDVWPAWPAGEAELKALNKMMHDASWLHSLRNHVGFHYPSFEDWVEFVTPNDTWVDDKVYAGQEPGNQFFEGPDAIVRHQMFSAAEGPTPADQVDIWVSQAVDLLVHLSVFTEHAVGHFMMAHLLPNGWQTKHVGKVLAPRLDDVEIPFWTREAKGKKVRAAR